MNADLEKWFDEQLEESKGNVRTFINQIFGEGKGTEYTDRDVYDLFYKFNFDWLNYTPKIFVNNPSKGAPLCKTWCGVPLEIQRDTVEEGFRSLTGIQASKKMQTISELNNRKFRGCADPDSMKMVCDILFVIYSKVIKETLEKLNEDWVAENINALKKQGNRYLFKGDTMHSFHSSFGHPEYQGHPVKNSTYEYIFMYPYITGFTKVKFDKLDSKTQKRIKKFFNLYHTLGNFVLTPAIKINKCSINSCRSRIEKDNYYAYVDKLFQRKDWKASSDADTLGKLISANWGFFAQFCEATKEKYCDDLDVLYIKGQAYTKKRQEMEPKQDEASINAYLEELEKIITERCKHMIKKLYDALNSKSDKTSKP